MYFVFVFVIVFCISVDVLVYEFIFVFIFIVIDMSDCQGWRKHALDVRQLELYFYICILYSNLHVYLYL